MAYNRIVSARDNSGIEPRRWVRDELGRANYPGVKILFTLDSLIHLIKNSGKLIDARHVSNGQCIILHFEAGVFKFDNDSRYEGLTIEPIIEINSDGVKMIIGYSLLFTHRADLVQCSIVRSSYTTRVGDNVFEFSVSSKDYLKLRDQCFTMEDYYTLLENLGKEFKSIALLNPVLLDFMLQHSMQTDL